MSQLDSHAQTAPLNYSPQLHIVLFEPEIPHNAGAIGRTCVALGAKLWLVKPLGFSLDDYYLKRAGLDYWPALEWGVVENWTGLREALPNHRYWYFSKLASRNYTEVQFQVGDVIVFGSESRGLPAAVLPQQREQMLRLPMRPQVRSLNVSNTAAVLMFEAWRQWTCAD